MTYSNVSRGDWISAARTVIARKLVVWRWRRAMISWTLASSVTLVGLMAAQLPTAASGHPPGDGSGSAYCSDHGGYTLPRGSTATSATGFTNVYPCGPNGGYASGDLFMPYWQCVEYAARYLFNRGYEIPHYDYGKNFATQTSQYFPSLQLVSEGNGRLPAAGDIISMWGGATTDQAGHVAVVSGATPFDASGGATISVVEQNASAAGQNTIAVTGWGTGMAYNGGSAYSNYTQFNWVRLGISNANAGFEAAFQANGSHLWAGGVGPGSSGFSDWNLGMLQGTSPSVTALDGGGLEVAFQASTTDDLWTVGYGPGAINKDWGLGMMPGTSPSIAGLPGGGFEVAFQANTTALWTVGYGPSTINQNWGLGMLQGSSPSITGLLGGGFEVAFQANTTALWTVGYGPGTINKNWNLGMLQGTSPSITGLSSGGFEVGFQANTTHLWTGGVGGGSTGFQDWNLGMLPGTSPAIARLVGGGFEVAFQANTTTLWTGGVGGGSTGFQDWNLGMLQGTSPSITGLSSGGFEVAFQANTSHLYTGGVGGGSTGFQDWGLRLMPGTSPGITATAQSQTCRRCF